MKTLNKNVPSNAKVIFERVLLSGEVIETIYEKDEKFYFIDDWAWSRPEEISKEYVEYYLKKLDKD